MKKQAICQGTTKVNQLKNFKNKLHWRKNILKIKTSSCKIFIYRMLDMAMVIAHTRHIQIACFASSTSLFNNYFSVNNSQFNNQNNNNCQQQMAGVAHGDAT
jgi:hypothetical protein